MFLIDWFSGISHSLATFLIAMFPIGELRASLPIALTVYHLDFWGAFILSIAGNLVPALLLLIILDPVSKFAENHSQLIHRFLNWLYERTRTRHNHKFEVYKDLALVLFVAIPLPFTGVYTGAIAAYVFGVPFRRAFPLIVLGVIIAAVIVSIITLGSKGLINVII